MNDFINCRSLQLFAEEAVAPESGVMEADAQPQLEEPAGDPGEFEKLIQGPYKQAYDARVKDILQQRQAAEIQAGASRMVEAWNAQESEIREVYPEFDLRKEMENPRFTELLRARVDMRSAYELLHRDEIIPAAMRYAAQMVERKLAENLRSAQQRPSENGISGGPAAVPGSRVAQMTRKEIQEACLRVQRGEKISFG